jgi:predicted esterase
MVPRDADELPASTAFRRGLYRLFERGHIVRCYRRAWKSRNSGEVSDAKRERWLTKTQRPKRIALHSDWSRRAIAIADLAAQGRWLCFRVVCRRRIIPAPESPGQSWGTGPKNWGYDYVAINRALEEAFARCAIDRNRLAIAGFSDGASYALSLGLANGDVFGYVIAFSPGFIVRAHARGRLGNNNEVQIPRVYIAHGTGDNVLPIASTSRVFVSSLRKNGYDVEFREFSGGHHVSHQVAEQAMTWLAAAFHQRG